MDGVSHSSAPPDLDTGMDDFATPTTRGSTPDAEVSPTTTASCILCNYAIRVKVVPTLGVSGLIETPPPALLFVDKDERPYWLLTSVKDFLQYGPYYMCLSRVVDLFLSQEAQLGYLAKVSKL